jgi:excisionase family DNA binding protein
VTDLRSHFAPELVAAIEQLVDERVAAALEERPEGSSSPWLTVPEAADYLRTSERTVQRLLKRRRIRTSAIGRRRLLRREDLDTFMEATTGEGTAPTVPPRRRRS